MICSMSRFLFLFLWLSCACLGCNVNQPKWIHLFGNHVPACNAKVQKVYLLETAPHLPPATEPHAHTPVTLTKPSLQPLSQRLALVSFCHKFEHFYLELIRIPSLVLLYSDNWWFLFSFPNNLLDKRPLFLSFFFLNSTRW